MTLPTRFNVLGTGVSAVSLEEARDFVLAARGRKNLGYICHATAYGINMARSDDAFRSALNGSQLTIRWHAARLAGALARAFSNHTRLWP